jgi:hypothetical protein
MTHSKELHDAILNGDSKKAHTVTGDWSGRIQ